MNVPTSFLELDCLIQSMASNYHRLLGIEMAGRHEEPVLGVADCYAGRLNFGPIIRIFARADEEFAGSNAGSDMLASRSVLRGRYVTEIQECVTRLVDPLEAHGLVVKLVAGVTAGLTGEEGGYLRRLDEILNPIPRLTIGIDQARNLERLLS